jgi:hypothetical protein
VAQYITCHPAARQKSFAGDDSKILQGKQEFTDLNLKGHEERISFSFIFAVVAVVAVHPFCSARFSGPGGRNGFLCDFTARGGG